MKALVFINETSYRQYLWNDAGREMMWRSLTAFFLVSTATLVVAVETYETERLAEDGIHDPENEAIQILQEPVEAMVDFPMDRRGKVDWVQAIRSGKINPRRSLSGDEFGGEMMLEMDMDIIMKQTANMPHVRFPHLAHTEWLTCNNCHSKIFQPQYEANPITMEKILKGEYCGRCHDKVSFSLWTCERCHSVPHENSSEAWVNPAR